MAHRPLNLGFVGDIMLGRHISRLLPGTRPERFWGNALPVLRATDGVIGNLESPITRASRCWDEGWKAFRFRADPGAVEILEAANIRMVNLANNHMLDYGARGMLDTLGYLDAAGIGRAGAGSDIREATEPAIAEIGGVRVALIGITDNMAEFAAGHDRPGTNHMKIRDDGATLTALRLLIASVREQGAGIVVLSCHWGPNLRWWPPARFRRFARSAIELGADVIHGHSAHLFQGVERHRGGVILYDTGDILDDYWIFPGIRTDHSFVFVTEFEGARLSRVRMRPVVQERTALRLATRPEAAEINRRMTLLCARLGTAVLDDGNGLEIAPAGGRMYPAPVPAGLPGGLQPVVP